MDEGQLMNRAPSPIEMKNRVFEIFFSFKIEHLESIVSNFFIWVKNPKDDLFTINNHNSR